MAFANPICTSRGSGSLVIVLDGGLSRRAGENHMLARTEAESLLQDLRPGACLAVIDAGRTPQLLATQTVSKETARAALTRTIRSTTGAQHWRLNLDPARSNITRHPS